MFYARRRTRKLSPDRVDAWVKSYEKEVPAMLRMTGFMGAYLFADRATGEGESFSFWESKQALESSRSSTDTLGSQQKVEIGLETVSVESLEVIAKTGDKVHAGATHALVLEGITDPPRLDAGRALYEDEILPALREDRGFLGVFILADVGSGKTVTVALYDSLANLESAERRQDRLRTDEFRWEAAHHYEIIARTVIPAPAAT